MMNLPAALLGPSLVAFETRSRTLGVSFGDKFTVVMQYVLIKEGPEKVGDAAAAAAADNHDDDDKGDDDVVVSVVGVSGDAAIVFVEITRRRYCSPVFGVRLYASMLSVFLKPVSFSPSLHRDDFQHHLTHLSPINAAVQYQRSKEQPRSRCAAFVVAAETRRHLSSTNPPPPFKPAFPVPRTRTHARAPPQCRLQTSSETVFSDKVMSLVQNQIVSAVTKVSKENNNHLLSLIEDAIAGKGAGGGRGRAARRQV